RIGPAFLPAVEVSLGFFQTLEAKSLQRRLLCVSNSGFDLAFAVRVLYAAGQSNRAIVMEHVPIQRVERGIIHIGREHTLAQIIENDNTRRTAQPAKRFLVQLSPGSRTGAEDQ